MIPEQLAFRVSKRFYGHDPRTPSDACRQLGWNLERFIGRQLDFEAESSGIGLHPFTVTKSEAAEFAYRMASAAVPFSS